ncbi:MAG: hypothetical protein JNJ77_14920 [Planctomycetia bacterium]|nr:hypothetical protein [Planctomycetia bacterium]
MAKVKFDAKEFMLQYGDRIGVGIAGFLALLFLVFAILGTSGGVSAEQVKDSGKNADDAIRRSEVNPEKIALKDEATVKPLNQIDELSRSLTKQISIDQLQLAYRFFEPEVPRGKFRSNPKVLDVIELAVEPLIGAFRMYEIRYVNNNEEVMVVTPRAGVKAPNLGQNKNNFQQGNGQNLGTGGPPGGGLAGGGLGMGQGSGRGGPPGAGRGKLGGKGGLAGGNQGKSTTTTTKAPSGNPGGDESIYTFVWQKNVAPNDILGVTIRPLRSAYIAATYPHGKQTEEIAKKLQIQPFEVERLYRRIDVQRRRIIPKGTLLPDGKYTETELVEVANPRDRSKMEYKTQADIDKALASLDDQSSDKDRDAAAGWTDINIRNVAAVMRTAYSVVRSNNEPFYTEKESIIQELLDYAGPRIALRLPRMVRNDEYPDIMSKLPTLMAAVKKIKDDAKAKIPPPPRDSRITGGTMEEFEGTGGTESEDSKKDKPKDAPEQSSIPDYIPIRFIDVDLPTELVGGTTYEYRIRMVLNNPNFKRESDVAAPEYARDEMLFGDWSKAARVSFEPDDLIYAGERDRAKGTTDDREKDKVPVQLHSWLGKARTLGGNEMDFALVGDWWVEKLLIGRGEYIGRSPDAPGAAGESNLVQWISYAFDSVNNKVGADVQKKTRTLDLYTENLLVDFHGGTYQSYRSDFARTTKREDVPAELLILTADGRLIARQTGDDAQDTGRQKRLEHWKNWVEKLHKPGDKK